MKAIRIGLISVSFLIGLAVISSALGSKSDTSQTSTSKSYDTTTVSPKSTPAAAEVITEKIVPTCDGSAITESCTVEGIAYKTYIHHAATPEVSHSENTTTYEKQQVSVCTLCNDGTRSPSCSTGKGTCSHHDGVAEWNAPVYSNVPVTTTKTVIDTPAQAAYFEKVAQ